MKENGKRNKHGFIVMPCLVLDLDGTVRRSKSGRNFIEDANDIEIIPEMYNAIKIYKDRGYYIAGATNESNIGKGLQSLEEVKHELTVTDSLLDGMFDSISFCPDFIDGNVFEYSFRSLAMKPDYGLLVLIEKNASNQKVIIDWNNSLIVANRKEDEEMAKNARVSFYQAGQFLEMMGILKKSDK